MSRPIRAHDGCVIGSMYSRKDSPPIWIRKGKRILEAINKCPTKIHSYWVAETPLFWGDKLVGAWEERQRGSSYVSIKEHCDRGLFFCMDVYCKQCEQWHFRGLS